MLFDFIIRRSAQPSSSGLPQRNRTYLPNRMCGMGSEARERTCSRRGKPRFIVSPPKKVIPIDFDYLVECFRNRFEGGFNGKDIRRERDYKERVASRMEEELGKRKLRQLLKTGDYREVWRGWSSSFFMALQVCKHDLRAGVPFLAPLMSANGPPALTFSFSRPEEG